MANTVPDAGDVGPQGGPGSTGVALAASVGGRGAYGAQLTADAYLDLMKHAIGKTPDDRHKLINSLNWAGRQLWTEWDWSFKKRGPFRLGAAADQEWFDLPDDYDHILTAVIDRTDTASYSYSILRSATLNEIQNLRTQAVQWSDGFYVNWPHYSSQPSRLVEPKRRAMCYPTPLTDNDPIITINYMGRWAEISDQDTGVVPNIPIEYEQALALLCRAIAIHLEDQQLAAEDPLYQAEIKRLRTNDALGHPRVGRVRGGAKDRQGSLTHIRVGEIEFN